MSFLYPIRVEMVSRYARERGVRPSRVSHSPDLVFAYVNTAFGSVVFAPWGIHLVLRLWYHRWRALDPLLDCGILTLADGDYYRNVRLSPPKKWFRGRVLIPSTN